MPFLKRLRWFISGCFDFYRKGARAFVLFLVILSITSITLTGSAAAATASSSSVLPQQQAIASNTTTTTSDIWYKVVALPLFNDSMLGASDVTSYDPVIPGLGNIYNFVLIIAIIMIMVGGAIALILRRMGKQGSDSMIMDVIIGLIAIMAFPLIYDNIARMINYLTQTLIAYPSPYYDYGTTLQVLWNNMEFSHGWSLWTLLTNSFLQIVFFIISGIVYIMLFFLGVARIFLIGAMLVAFPLSMGLRLIPFTKKLSSMIDDTLFGLMLASIMSSVVLGVGSYILSPGVWNSSSSSAGNNNIFFQAVGSNGQNWVAAASLLTAILMPTVLAPLTATIFQTASQIAMTGVGVATAVLTGAASGGAGGLSAAGSAVGTLGKTAQITGQPPPTVAQKLVAGMKAFGTTGLPAIGYNVATLGTAGFVSALGAEGAGVVMRRAVPIQTVQTITSRAQAKQAFDVGEAHAESATRSIQRINSLSLTSTPVSSIHIINPSTAALSPNWRSIKLPEGQAHELLDPKNDAERLKSFVSNNLTTPQSLSDTLIDHKIITPEAAKNPKVQSQIREIHSKIRNMDLNNEDHRQQLANLHNHLVTSKKLGRSVKESDFFFETKA